ncbi:hypothetical protein ALI144C_02890 [Actinosynnema sp. ALI-1.44]|nr:hypothetical protein ALI144C_02890 [Actinosynnema sp. ALI-1.44]
MPAAVVALYDDIPSGAAPATERVAWLDRKAAVFDRLATCTDARFTDSDRAYSAARAVEARHAAHIIREQEAQR